MPVRFDVGDRVVLRVGDGPVKPGACGTVRRVIDEGARYEVEFGHDKSRTIADHHLDSGPLRLYRALEQEYEAVHGSLPDGYRAAVDKLPPQARLKRLHTVIHALGEPRSALCLSGGGIRSATFSLGVLQGLAGAGLLSKFHYLSTVSGGGYIGSWIGAWASRHKDGIAGVEQALKHAGSVAACAAGVKGKAPPRPSPATAVDPGASPEPREVQWLRQYSNYLSPRRGILSADTWVLVASYFRNLLLNWMVLIPLLAAVLMLPRIGVWLIRVPQYLDERGRGHGAWEFSLRLMAVVLLVGGTALHVYTVAYRVARRPSRREPGDTGPGENEFLRHVLIPLVVAGAMLVTGWAALRRAVSVEFLWGWHLLGMMVTALLLGVVGTIWGSIIASRTDKHPPAWAGWKAALTQYASLVVEGVLAGLFLWLVAKRPWADPWAHPRLYATVALPLYLMIFVTAAIAGRVVTTHVTRDDDREWTARGAGWVMLAASSWLVAAGLVLFGPSLLLLLHAKARTAMIGLGGLTGLLTGWLARSPLTPATHELPAPAGRGAALRGAALKLAAPLFIAFLVTIVSLATDWLVTRGGGLAPYLGQDDWHRAVLLDGHIVPMIAWLIALPVVATVTSRFVDVNKYSLNAVYRSRLSRAYLGASRLSPDCLDNDNPARSGTADSFTGFDYRDSPRMTQLTRRSGAGGARLFHVVNMALNLVRGDNLAWQQRKAQSFTATPLHCGSGDLRDAGGDRTGAYRPSSEYAAGGPDRRGLTWPISVGMAMSISGAAASPNMGYHSSPAIAFLMTLLNVRLGAWLGNPGIGGEKTYRDWAPRYSLQALWYEALSWTDDRGQYVYLSDGGHFENLGLYEMVRRRCRYVVAVDAGQDKECQFADLGSAVRKIYIDMGIRVEFSEGMRIYARTSGRGGNDGQYVAVARIRYAEVDDPPPGMRPDDIDGWLLYIKPAFYEKEPPDIFNYAMSCKDFPHETTADQFFSESQFESYRALGAYIVAKVLAEKKGGVTDVSQLFRPDNPGDGAPPVAGPVA